MDANVEEKIIKFIEGRIAFIQSQEPTEKCKKRPISRKAAFNKGVDRGMDMGAISAYEDVIGFITTMD